MSESQLDMSVFFAHKPGDSSAQLELRNSYLILYWMVNDIKTLAGAEKSVAKRKLLESLDAALRAAG